MKHGYIVLRAFAATARIFGVKHRFAPVNLNQLRLKQGAEL